MTSIIGDVCDLEHLMAVTMRYQPEILIHMAAQSLVRHSYINPVETYATNVMGTVNVLEAARQAGCVKVVLIVTSDKCYENKEWLWGYRENDPLGGYDPYSSSKACAELVTSAYRRSYFYDSKYPAHGVAVASVRAGNVIGGGDWAENRLIPDIIRAFIENCSLIIRNPSSIRPWQFVLEPLDGYLCLMEKLWDFGAEFAGGWNFGPNVEDCKTVSWIVATVNRLLGRDVKWQRDTSENPAEAAFLKLDCSKARRLLGWSPKMHIENSLEWVVKWYEGYIENKNMRDISEGQLSSYEHIGL
jgi:CDP-glucose 4,6-dehydratase